MSEPQRAQERPIVVHGPITGDPARTIDVVRPAPTVTATAGLATATFEQPPVAPVPVSVAPTERVLGLDAFRGALILAMNFAFTIPGWGPFPGWMYHMQVPPSPDGAYVALAGITWRDMLFALFVFTMAAALPVVMSARLAKGKPYPEILWIAVRRAFLLTVFALLIGHVNPYWTEDYTRRGNVMAIAGLLVAFALFVQPPRAMGPAGAKWLRRLAWTAAGATLFVLPLAYGKTFDPQRKDGIIAAVAFCTVAATALWLLTRKRLGLRLGVFAAIVAGRWLAPIVPGLAEVWYARPFPWFYEPWYLELLLIAIAGTIAGDLVVRLTRSRSVVADARAAWSGARQVAIALLGASVPVTLTVGLYERRHPTATLVAVVVTCGALLLLTRGAASGRERVVARLCAWASLWLVTGMLAEPLEGGIRKDPQTLGYLLLMSGVATAGLASMLLLLDGFPRVGRRLRPLALVGQNALFAYVVYMLGIGHVLWLAGAGRAFTDTWPMALARSVLLTTITGVIVWLSTRRRLVWKT